MSGCFSFIKDMYEKVRACCRKKAPPSRASVPIKVYKSMMHLPNRPFEEMVAE
ncbi:hypothetical protein MMC34_002706 [Xylographa carneopallida]|nr:hypothetical protein [Xylographa carneopallida]